MKLHWQIFIALALALAVGASLQHGGGAEQAVPVFAFIGTLFLNALKMLIVPLIVSSIVTGVAGLGSTQGFGRLGLKTITYYIVTTLLAVCVGLLLVDLFKPGIIDGQPARFRLALSADTDAVMEKVAGTGAGEVAAVFLRLVPVNVAAAAAEGDMLGLIFFSLVFGYFLTRLPADSAAPMARFWKSAYDVMLLITDWIMKFAPIGVFALVAKVVATTGVDAFRPLATFFLVVLAGLAIHTFITLPALLLLVGRVYPLRHFRAMMPAMLTAFSTASSSATLPLTIECVENRARVSNRTASFVLPLGATINMDGTALYECVAAMFIAQAYGLELTLTTQFIVVLLALLTSIGVAGIPAASLVAIVVILKAIGLPAEGIGLILAVDRVLDMCRTSVNIFSDSCGAVIIARLEGEKDILPAR